MAASERVGGVFRSTAASGLVTDDEERKQWAAGVMRNSLPIVTRAHAARQGIGTGVRDGAGGEAGVGEVQYMTKPLVELYEGCMVVLKVS